MRQTEPDDLYSIWLSQQQYTLSVPSEDYAVWYARATIAAIQASEVHLGTPTAQYEEWFKETIGDKLDGIIQLLQSLTNCISDNTLKVSAVDPLPVDVKNKVHAEVNGEVHVTNTVDVKITNEPLAVKNHMIMVEEVEFPEPLFVLAAEKDILGHPKKFECDVMNEPYVRIKDEVPVAIKESIELKIESLPKVQLADGTEVDIKDPAHVIIDSLPPVEVSGDVSVDVNNSTPLEVEVKGLVGLDVATNKPLPVVQVLRNLDATAANIQHEIGGYGTFRELSMANPVPHTIVGPDNGAHYSFNPQLTSFPRAVASNGYVWANVQNSRTVDVHVHNYGLLDEDYRTVLATRND